jgi:hypothetical protein
MCPEFSPAHEYDYFPIDAVESYFCRHHVIWLLANIDVLREGIYPVKYSGYINQPVRKQSQKAPYERVIQLYTHLNIKFLSTGKDGETLIDEIDSGLKWPVARTALKALNYIAGTKMRKESYSHFKEKEHKYVET